MSPINTLKSPVDRQGGWTATDCIVLTDVSLCLSNRRPSWHLQVSRTVGTWVNVAHGQLPPGRNLSGERAWGYYPDKVRMHKNKCFHPWHILSSSTQSFYFRQVPANHGARIINPSQLSHCTRSRTHESSIVQKILTVVFLPSNRCFCYYFHLFVFFCSSLSSARFFCFPQYLPCPTNFGSASVSLFFLFLF